MAGEESEANISPQPAVNNFVAAKNFAARFGWRSLSIFTIQFCGFPHRRARSANDQSLQRLSAYRPAHRRGLTL
jgi:hypothetical protein